MYDMIRSQLAKSVPFARHAGIEITAISDGSSETELQQSDTSINHIGSQHAGAIFTLGEAASGAAMAGAFAPFLLKMRPVAASATIDYLKIAKGTLSAKAKVEGDTEALRSKLTSNKKVSFPVNVEISNSDDIVIASMSVNWHLKIK